jgi:hypothetical protein
MYYHMDMHGGPYSFKWIGATYLPRVWEQMTQAYDFGVRQIWVVNVGDIGVIDVYRFLHSPGSIGGQERQKIGE